MSTVVEKLVPHNVEGRKMMKFRINIGQACVVGKDGRVRLFQQGQRCETPTNLTKRFPGEKFTRISDGDNVDEGQLFEVEMDAEALKHINADDLGEFKQITRQEESDFDKPADYDPSANSTLSEMSLDDLFKLAAEEEIPLGNAKTKKAVIEKIDSYNRLGSIANQ